jgi:DNA gyrase subunit A
VNEADELVSAALTDGKKEILLVTAAGMAIRFDESEVRPMGLLAAGVSGIRLDSKDVVVGGEVLPAAGDIFLMASDGRAKRVDQKDFPKQGRYGKGVAAWPLPHKVVLAGIATGKGNTALTVHHAKSAPRAHRMDEASLRKRSAARGDRLVELKAGDRVVAITTGWMLERFIRTEPKEESPKPKKAAAARKASGRASRGSKVSAKAGAKRKTRGRPKSGK